MIQKIKQIIAENSEEKHFVEYGKGIFATEDAVDEMAESIVKLFAIARVSKSFYCNDEKHYPNLGKCEKECAMCRQEREKQ